MPKLKYSGTLLSPRVAPFILILPVIMIRSTWCRIRIRGKVWVRVSVSVSVSVGVRDSVSVRDRISV